MAQIPFPEGFPVDSAPTPATQIMGSAGAIALALIVGGSITTTQWGGVDDSDFDADNDLPDPGFESGATNPELNIVANTQTPTQNSIAITADEIAGGAAVFWFDTEVPLADLKGYELEFAIPLPGADTMSTEEVFIGVVFGGDLDGHIIADTVAFTGDGAGNTTFSHRVLQSEPIGPTNVLLLDDELPGGGYVWNLRGELWAASNDTDYAGGTGVPCGSIRSVVNVFAPAPTSGGLFPHGSVAILNSVVYPPGTSWATSACNRIGLIVGGAWTTATSGAQTISILRARFFT